MNPVATSDAAFRGGACPTPEYTIAYTGNYTTSADANRLWRVSVFQGNLWDREETNRRTDLKAQRCRNHRNRTRTKDIKSTQNPPLETRHMYQRPEPNPHPFRPTT